MAIQLTAADRAALERVEEQRNTIRTAVTQLVEGFGYGLFVWGLVARAKATP